MKRSIWSFHKFFGMKHICNAKELIYDNRNMTTLHFLTNSNFSVWIKESSRISITHSTSDYFFSFQVCNLVHRTWNLLINLRQCLLICALFGIYSSWFLACAYNVRIQWEVEQMRCWWSWWLEFIVTTHKPLQKLQMLPGESA